jgi:uncharacterized membrane protein YhaH (DUF805 family)
MIGYYVDFWKNYVNFNGRARRAAYWYTVLMHLIIGVAIGVLTVFIPAAQNLAYVYSLAALVPGISLCVRRLHDLGKSGLWYLLVFIPFIGAIVLLIWFCKPGIEGDTPYGPDPKGTPVIQMNNVQ